MYHAFPDAGGNRRASVCFGCVWRHVAVCQRNWGAVYGFLGCTGGVYAVPGGWYEGIDGQGFWRKDVVYPYACG